MNYGDCANYVASLINKAAELSAGTNPAVGTDMIANFERIRKQPNGGISLAPPDPRVSGGGGTAEYRNGAVQIKITPLGYYQENTRGAYSIPFRYGLNGLHELIHGAGQNGTYSEGDLTRAARALEPKAGYSASGHSPTSLWDKTVPLSGNDAKPLRGLSVRAMCKRSSTCVKWGKRP